MGKSEITYLAKRMCQANRRIRDAVQLASELSNSELFRSVCSDKSSVEWLELCEKISKYDPDFRPADMCGPELDDIMGALEEIYEFMDQ